MINQIIQIAETTAGGVRPVSLGHASGPGAISRRRFRRFRRPESRQHSTTTRQYNSAGTVGNATISVDPETRQLIVITDEETSEQISQVVTNLDRPKPQVLIKVVFVEVTHADGSDIGVEGGFTGTDNGITGNAADVFGLSRAEPDCHECAAQRPRSARAELHPHPAGRRTLSNSRAGLSGDAPRHRGQSGKAKILSRPSILARNNQPANILVGQSVPLITNVRYDTFGNAINSVSYTDVGIILRVTPFITSDGQVEMIVTPEISIHFRDRIGHHFHRGSGPGH